MVLSVPAVTEEAGVSPSFIHFSVTDLQSPAQPEKGATASLLSLQCREIETGTALSLSHFSAGSPLSKVFPSLGFLAKSSSFHC